MLRMIFVDKVAAPIIECDACHDMIGAAAEGIAVYPDLSGNGRGLTKGNVFHVHKEKCRENFLGLNAKAHDTQPLQDHLKFLCGNTEVVIPTSTVRK